MFVKQDSPKEEYRFELEKKVGPLVAHYIIQKGIRVVQQQIKS